MVVPTALLLHTSTYSNVCKIFRRAARLLDTRRRVVHQRVLAARRRDPQPQGVRDAQRAVQAGGALAQQAS